MSHQLRANEPPTRANEPPTRANEPPTRVFEPQGKAVKPSNEAGNQSNEANDILDNYSNSVEKEVVVVHRGRCSNNKCIIVCLTM